MHNLAAHVEFREISSGVAASDTSTDWYSGWVDTRGFEGVTLIAHLNSSGDPSGTYHCELSTTSTATSGTDIYGTSGTLSTDFAADSSLVISDIFRPRVDARYVRFYFDRATTGESVISLVAALSSPHLLATSNSTTYNVSDVNIAIGTSS